MGSELVSDIAAWASGVSGVSLPGCFCWGSNLPPPWETLCSPTALLTRTSCLSASSALFPFLGSTLASAPGTSCSPCSQSGMKNYRNATITVDPLGTTLSRGRIQCLPHGNPAIRLPREAPVGP